ncbi:MAG TPA: molybdenum ABC transporter ATP-binding protein [Xanthobacteraceae bacterium]|jgi:molybdate transport system ATP-binding protein|nr:molybdenum ABC transporter ATP-binding protein [Xanthobacteraceae bacterium]
MLTVDIDKTLGTFRLTAQFEAADRVTALFGQSGAGKTSLINMVGGLVAPDRGRIVLDGEVLFDAARRINVPVHRRRIGYVFQEGRLFPHLDVRRNLDYGRWMRGLAHDAQAHTHILAMLDIGDLMDRRPAQLSGGERQRVAIGRALLMQPRMLLLDEPLASLDAARKAEILPYLERLRDDAGMPMLYVSHDRAEVARIAQTILHIADGRIMPRPTADALFAVDA